MDRTFRAISLKLTPASHRFRTNRRPTRGGYGTCSELCLGCGGPFLKPVMRTNSFSRDAATSGALLSRVSTECTACVYALDTSSYFLPVLFEGRETTPVRNA